jgi:hypothetical protein
MDQASSLWSSIYSSVGEILPGLVGGLLAIVIGWFIAIIARAAVRRGANALNLNERLGGGQQVDVASILGKTVYWVVIAFTILAFLTAVELNTVATPLQGLLNKLMAFLPNILAGLALALVAWVLATVVRTGTRAALGATTLDDKVSEHAGMSSMSENLSQVIYWVIWLLFLPAILGTLQLSGLLEPVEEMTEVVLSMIPNIVAAALIGVIGWFVARIVRDLLANLLSATGVDRLGETLGLSGTLTLSRLIALVVYVLILVPAIIGALNALKLDSLTQPATAMLDSFLAAIPNVFAAGVILTIAVVIARFAADLARQLLSGAGFDALPERMGIAGVFSGDYKPSHLVGQLIVFFTVLFASVEAANRVGFSAFSGIVATFIEFGGQVLLGTLIIAVGFWLSNIAHGALSRAGSSAAANIGRFAILGLVLAMGLRAMGLADDIVNLAFGLTLGSVAIAVALSFGLGGREAAGRQMEHWLSNLRG